MNLIENERSEEKKNKKTMKECPGLMIQLIQFKEGKLNFASDCNILY